MQLEAEITKECRVPRQECRLRYSQNPLDASLLILPFCEFATQRTSSVLKTSSSNWQVVHTLHIDLIERDCKNKNEQADDRRWSAAAYLRKSFPPSWRFPRCWDWNCITICLILLRSGQIIQHWRSLSEMTDPLSLPDAWGVTSPTLLPLRTPPCTSLLPPITGLDNKRTCFGSWTYSAQQRRIDLLSGLLFR